MLVLQNKISELSLDVKKNTFVGIAFAPADCLNSSFFDKKENWNEEEETEEDDLISALEACVEASLEADDSEIDFSTAGVVHSLGDGIAKVKGLKDAGIGDYVVFESGETGIVLGIELSYVSVVVFGNYENIKQSDIVFCTNVGVGVIVGPHLLGKVVNVLGESLDPLDSVEMPSEDSEEYALTEWRLADVKAPGIVARQSVREPVYTGLVVIDSMVPIGRGQRELIIGDRKTGKTSIALDAIINQGSVSKNESELIKCVYVSIGQKASSVALLAKKLKEFGAMRYTTIVAATAADSASLQFLAPYVGCAIAEFYRDSGEHALVVYDDLSKQAVAYRQMSLLLRRPPGREAYPGDVFYIHSRLLERASKMSDEYGAGSLTALPIIETQAGDVSAYIPTNVISITDGQIVLDNALFHKGVRPAVNVGLSVSRVGSSAQIPAMKQLAGSLKLELAQYREVLIFEKIGGDLDEITKLKLKRGKALVEILKQVQFNPLTVDHQIMLIYAGSKGFIDGLNEDEIADFKLGLSTFMKGVKEHFEEDGALFDRSAKLDTEDETFMANVIRHVLSTVKFDAV